MYYTYIIRLSSGNFYVGQSSNLKRRIEKHNSGKVKSTKNFTPASLVFYAAFKTKEKSLSFEKYLKSSSGTAFRNKRLVS